MKTISLLFLTILMITPVFGGRLVVELSDSADLDKTGQGLRQALNAWYAAADEPLPNSWTKLSLRIGESEQLDRDHHFLVLESNPSQIKLMVISPDGPVTETLSSGADRVLGPIRVLLLESDDRGARILFRQATPSLEYLSDVRHPLSAKVEILGFEDPNRMEVISSDLRALDFSKVFVNQFQIQRSAHDASIEAFDRVPPSDPNERFADQVSIPGPSPDRAYAPEVFDEQPYSAMITFRVVRGSAEAFRSLSSDIQYTNQGNTPSDPRISGRANERGGKIEVGSPGDRFQAKLKALERSGNVSVTSESFIRVPIGGNGRFRFGGNTGDASGRVSVRPAGNRVELRFDQQTGDWSGFGIASTTLRFYDGQTIEAAKNTSSRTTSSRSGPPIIGDIPYIGGAVGSNSSSESSDSYVLYVTVELE